MNNLTINNNIPVPKYYQIHLILQERIQNQEWGPGESIPSERELCEEFKVSRLTIRQALANLVNIGYLRKEQGRGTFVAIPKLVEHTLTANARSTYQEWSRQGIQFDTRVLELKQVAPSPTVRLKLNLEKNVRIVSIERLLCIRREPIRYVSTYIPAHLCRGILNEDLTHQSLTTLLREKYGMAIFTSFQRLQAQPASELDLRLLNIDRGTPVFVLESINRDKEGSCLWMDIDRSRADRVMFEVATSENMMMRNSITSLVRDSDGENKSTGKADKMLERVR